MKFNHLNIIYFLFLFGINCSISSSCPVSTSNIIKGDTIEVKVKCFPSGNLFIRKKLVNGVRDGLFESFFENGKKESISFSLKGKYEGESKSWDSLGNLVWKCQYKDDHEVGECWSKWPNGKMKKLQNYDSLGKQSGIYKEWYESGQLQCKMEFKNDKVIKSEEYYRNGHMRLKEDYAYSYSKKKDYLVFSETFDTTGFLIGRVKNGKGVVIYLPRDPIEAPTDSYQEIYQDSLLKKAKTISTDSILNVIEKWKRAKKSPFGSIN